MSVQESADVSAIQKSSSSAAVETPITPVTSTSTSASTENAIVATNPNPTHSNNLPPEPEKLETSSTPAPAQSTAEADNTSRKEEEEESSEGKAEAKAPATVPIQERIAKALLVCIEKNETIRNEIMTRSVRKVKDGDSDSNVLLVYLSCNDQGQWKFEKHVWYTIAKAQEATGSNIPEKLIKPGANCIYIGAVCGGVIVWRSIQSANHVPIQAACAWAGRRKTNDTVVREFFEQQCATEIATIRSITDEVAAIHFIESVIGGWTDVLVRLPALVFAASSGYPIVDTILNSPVKEALGRKKANVAKIVAECYAMEEKYCTGKVRWPDSFQNITAVLEQFILARIKKHLSKKEYDALMENGYDFTEEQLHTATTNIISIFDSYISVPPSSSSSSPSSSSTLSCTPSPSSSASSPS